MKLLVTPVMLFHGFTHVKIIIGAVVSNIVSVSKWVAKSAHEYIWVIILFVPSPTVIYIHVP